MRQGDEVTWVDHPRYGKIPYRIVVGYDMDYRPELPVGAVRGEPRRQRGFCSHCQPPRYFYVDELMTCVQCGRGFVFGAKEQQFWYERLGFHIESVAIRCRDCRQAQRLGRRLQRRLDEATGTAQRQPDSAEAQLDLATAIVDHVAGLNSGSIDLAIRAARQALRLDPGLHVARYWEARAQELAGRDGRATEAYGHFIDAAHRSTRRSIRKLLEDARQRHAELTRRTSTPR